MRWQVSSPVRETASVNGQPGLFPRRSLTQPLDCHVRSVRGPNRKPLSLRHPVIDHERRLVAERAGVVTGTAWEAVSDPDLLTGVAAGDRDALAVLYERHAPWLLLRLGRRCQDRTVVDEVLQDTFVGVWRGAARYRGEGEVAAWMWGIAARRLIDRLRRKGFATVALEQRHPDPAESVEHQVLLGVEHGDIGGVLNALSPELRAVVQATVLDGLTTRETARLLGIPQGTVKTRMSRARAQMREALA